MILEQRLQARACPVLPGIPPKRNPQCNNTLPDRVLQGVIDAVLNEGADNLVVMASGGRKGRSAGRCASAASLEHAAVHLMCCAAGHRRRQVAVLPGAAAGAGQARSRHQPTHLADGGPGGWWRWAGVGLVA